MKDLFPHWDESMMWRGHQEACADLARKRPEDLDVGNPNHPINSGLFGQACDKFLARQYKRD